MADPHVITVVVNIDFSAAQMTRLASARFLFAFAFMVAIIIRSATHGFASFGF